jgi:DNA-binding transcriptional regulator WhiA
MSFTTDIKKEILTHANGEKSAAEKIAAFSAFVRTSGTLGFSGAEPSFFLVSETEVVAECFMERFAEIFEASYP